MGLVWRIAAGLLTLVAVGVAVALALSSASDTGSRGSPPTNFPPVAFPPAPARFLAPAVDARYVSPRGSDAGPGTAQRPWRTLGKAVSAAEPGETVVLLPGVYGARGQRTDWTASGTASAPITFEGARGATRPKILGYNKVEGSHLRITGLSFEGPTGRVDTESGADPSGEEVLVWLAGDDLAMTSCEVAGARWHAGVYVAGAGNVRLVANYIHDNGDFASPAQRNLDHGVYWAHGAGGLIADNLIVHNVAMGVQLYPGASHVTVEQNTILGNGKSGVIVAEDSAHNTIVNNIVADNSDDGIRSYGLTGAGNAVLENVMWDNGSETLNRDTEGLTLRDNLAVDPRFVDQDDYRLRPNSPAAGHALRTSATLPYDIAGRSENGSSDIGAY